MLSKPRSLVQMKLLAAAAMLLAVADAAPLVKKKHKDASKER